MIKIGIAGKPNSGKSTFFKSATLADVEIANYPFTTIDANQGIAFARSVCPCNELDVHCGHCKDGIRFTPIEMIDVAGLVPDAHLGKGLGNEFLDNLRQADAIIDVIDASGSTDENGNIVEVGRYDPLKEVDFIEKELSMWLYNVIHRDWNKISRKMRQDGLNIFFDKLAGLNINRQDAIYLINKIDLPDEVYRWSDEELMLFSNHLIKKSKPILIVANKVDIAPEENIARLQKLNEKGYKVILTTADGELALRFAEKRGIVKYIPGDKDFDIINVEGLNKKQLDALYFIKGIMKKIGGTGVQEAINTAVFDILNMVVVYPVENEKKWTDKNGNILPDSFLLKRGSTPRDLAYQVHSEIGDSFLFAIDSRRNMRVGENYELKDNDVIKIVSTK